MYWYAMGRKLPVHHFDADNTAVHRSKIEDIRAAFMKNGLVLLCFIVTFKRRNS